MKNIGKKVETLIQKDTKQYEEYKQNQREYESLFEEENKSKIKEGQKGKVDYLKILINGYINSKRFEVIRKEGDEALDNIKNNLKNLLTKLTPDSSFTPIAMLGSGHWILLLQRENNNFLVWDSLKDNYSTISIQNLVSTYGNINVNDKYGNINSTYSIVFLGSGEKNESINIDGNNFSNQTINDVVKKVEKWRQTNE